MAETKRGVWLTLAILIGLGAFLRLYHLGVASLWIDEITFLSESDPDTSVFAAAKRMYSTYHWQHQPALPRVVELLFLRTARSAGLPMNEAVYRLPAALMGIASIPVLFLIGRHLFNERVGLIAAFLLSISFFHIYYSREAYNYSPFLFCALASWYFLGRILLGIRDGRRACLRDLILYGATTALALQMVMAAILFVFAQFLAVVLTAFVPPLRSVAKRERSALVGPVILAQVIAWAPFLPFLWRLLHYVSVDENSAQTVAVASFLGMIGEMGWGSRPLPLLLFICCALAGVGIGFSSSARRFQSALCFLLGVFSALGTGYIEQLGRYESRYFIILLPSLLLFVGIAWNRIWEQLRGRVPRPLRFAAWLAPFVVLFLWHAPFYNQLFQLRGKLLCGRDIAGWINENTSPGSVYVMDSFYVLREVPGFYETPARYESAVPVHQSIEEFRQFGTFFLDLFRRFPNFYYVDTQHFPFMTKDGEPTDWPQGYFRKKVAIANPALVRLFEMGIWPSGSFYAHAITEEATTTYIWYNSKADLVQLKRDAGEPALVLFERDWIHCMLPDYSHWKATHDAAHVEIHGLADSPIRAALWLDCRSLGTEQSIVAAWEGFAREHRIPADQPARLFLGEITLQPGPNRIRIRKEQPQDPDEFPNFLVHELRVIPLPHG